MKRGLLEYHGFKAGEIYRSGELFDFFERRTMNKINPFEELAKTQGVSMIDSFSVEPVSETLMPKYSKMISETYTRQEKLKQVKQRRQSIMKKPSLKVNSR